MAKISTTWIGSPDLASTYMDAMENVAHSKKSATYVETSGDRDKMIFSGSDLIYGTDGELYGGTVTKVTFVYGEDHDRTVIKGLHIAGADVPFITPAGSRSDIFDLLFAGDDVITGSDHADALRGGDGEDVLIGGKGRDEFYDSLGNDTFTGGDGADVYNFFEGSGRDVITDFDTSGPEGKHDLMLLSSSTSLRKSGHDVIIDFAGGGTVRVLDVTINAISGDIAYI